MPPPRPPINKPKHASHFTTKRVPCLPKSLLPNRSIWRVKYKLKCAVRNECSPWIAESERDPQGPPVCRWGHRNPVALAGGEQGCFLVATWGPPGKWEARDSGAAGKTLGVMSEQAPESSRVLKGGLRRGVPPLCVLGRYCVGRCEGPAGVLGRAALGLSSGFAGFCPLTWRFDGGEISLGMTSLCRSFPPGRCLFCLQDG